MAAFEAMRKYLGNYLIHYNTKRPHQGRDTKGGTSAEVYERWLLKIGKPQEKKLKKAV